MLIPFPNAPQPQVGDQVLYWPLCRKSAPPRFGYIEEVYDSAVVTIRLSNGQIIQAVHHQDDPGLSINESWRDSGCWDHTHEHRLRQILEGRVEALEREVESLKAKLGGGSRPTKKKATKKKPRNADEFIQSAQEEASEFAEETVDT